MPFLAGNLWGIGREGREERRKEKGGGEGGFQPFKHRRTTHCIHLVGNVGT